MIDKEVGAVVAAVIVVVGVFATSQALLSGRVVEPFSELGLLGPGMKIGDYPREVVVGQPFRLFVYIGNREGKTMYYQVRVKLGDRASFINGTVPMEAPTLAKYERVLVHNQTVIYPVELAIDREGRGLRLVFELWAYDEQAGQFKYHGRWNQLWINATAPPAA
ncbi:MAG: DUF1616 domain-containing protein [Candidatus Nezhaarchaeota archaeon]|nr:DUF1616 domain-containing protein [Candidatus Nezhaarchaeota archaeon]